MLIFSFLGVIHSWTILSINIKIDCNPNQIDLTNIISLKPSIMYGQKSIIINLSAIILIYDSFDGFDPIKEIKIIIFAINNVIIFLRRRMS